MSIPSVNETDADVIGEVIDALWALMSKSMYAEDVILNIFLKVMKKIFPEWLVAIVEGLIRSDMTEIRKYVESKGYTYQKIDASLGAALETVSSILIEEIPKIGENNGEN